MEKYEFTVPQKAAIMKGEKFLILKRAPDAHSYPNHRDFPGGRLEKGETPYNGLEREVREETNLEIKDLEPEFLFSRESGGINHLYIVYKCSAAEGNIEISKEHTEFRWATREEILKLECEPYLKAYLEGGQFDDKKIP